MLDILYDQPWSKLIKPTLFSYNNTRTVMTGYSPFKLIFGKAQNFPVDMALNLKIAKIQCTGCIDEYVREIQKYKEVIYVNANVAQSIYD